MAVRKLSEFEVMFDTVVRGYSLMGETNGERWLMSLVRPGATVFDVGFHEGRWTADLLNAVSDAKVHAFDPSRTAASAYHRRFSGDERVTFSNVALSSEGGSATLHDYDTMCSSLADRKETSCKCESAYSVEVETIDEYSKRRNIKRIDLLKIDAEGYDLHVLEGAFRSLKNERVDLASFEFGSGWTATRHYLWEAVEFFDPLPYSLFRLFNGFLVPLRYDVTIDSCTTRPAMYVAVSKSRVATGDIPIRDYRF
ncbi:MAG: FkbM family methyltransferase [Pseudomonadota bacterium]